MIFLPYFLTVSIGPVSSYFRDCTAGCTRMATPSAWTDIEEEFFRCSICLEIYKDPKLLPCLHRYCKECLERIIVGLTDIRCPLCQDETKIPVEGVDGYKTDFHMNGLLQFIHLQKSAGNKEMRECIGCTSHLEVSAYCFKCRDFLCEKCHTIHLTNRTLADHKNKVLALKDFKAHNLKPSDLSTLTEAPRCHQHLDQASVICCVTCGNLPICMVCGTMGEHRDHEVYDVKALAEIESKKLRGQLVALKKHNLNIVKVKEKTEEVRRTLDKAITDEIDRLNSQCVKEKEKITARLRQNEDEYNECRTQLTKKMENDLKEIQSKRDFEIEKVTKQINEIYDERAEESLVIYRKSLGERQSIHDQRKSVLDKEKNDSLQEFVDLKGDVLTQGEQNMVKLESILKQSANRLTRFQNLTLTANSILAANDDWTVTQCVPAIRLACQPLAKDMRKEFPELNLLSSIKIRPIQSASDDGCTFGKDQLITFEKDSGGIAECSVDHVTTSGDGHIVIYGRQEDERPKVVIMDKECNVICSDFNRKLTVRRLVRPFRRSILFSESNAVVVCHPKEIRLYDVSTGFFSNKTLSDDIDPSNSCVTCACTDQITEQVYVGTDSQSVYIFNKQLRFVHSLILPNEVTKLRHIAVDDNKIVVCDSGSNKAFSLTNLGYNCQVRHELRKPFPVERMTDFVPLSIANDSKRRSYILWGELSLGNIQVAASIMQYSEEGCFLQTRPAPCDAKAMTIQDTGERGRVVVVTKFGRKICLYELVRNL